jgi:putative membrane protein
MKKSVKKLASILLVTALMLQVLPVYAIKNETVYSKVNYAGEPKITIVSERISNDSKVTDYSELVNINNVNGNETFTRNGNKINWENVSNKDIFYQGTSTKELPINMEITYTLDGEEVNPKDIVTKKGHVVIRIKYVNNDKHEVNGETLYTPFVVTTGLVVNTNNISNLKGTNIRNISNGTKEVIVGLSVPGLYDSLKLSELNGLDNLTVEYDTESFEYPSIYSVAIPKLLETSDLNFLNSLDGLYDKVELLQNSINQISSGSKKLVNGTDTLVSGTNKLTNGTEELVKGSELLSTGSNDLVNGSTQLTNGIKLMRSEIAKNVYAIENDNSEALTNDQISSIVNNVLSQTKVSEEDLNKIISQVRLGIINNFITQEGMRNIDYSDTTIIASALVQNENYQTSTTKTILAAADIYKFTPEQKILLLKTNIDSSLTSASEAIKGSAESIAKQTASKVASSVAPLVANQVKSTMLNIMLTSLQEVDGGLQQLETGSGKISEGSLQLSKGLLELSNGTKTLNQGSKDLANGAKALAAGQKELNSGIDKFNSQGIKQITNLVNNKLKPTDKKIKELIKLSDRYGTFDIKNPNEVGTTKFITIVEYDKVVNEK